MDEEGKKDKIQFCIYISPPLKEDLEALAKAKGTSAGVLAKKILKSYVREEYYKKAQEILNFEDRVSTAVMLGLHPEIEEMRREIEKIKDLMKGVKSPAKQGETKKKEEKKKTIFKRAHPTHPDEKKEEGPGKEKVKLPPPIAGLNYDIKGDYAYYGDGSVWNLKIGAWIKRGEKVMKLKRKKDEELGR